MYKTIEITEAFCDLCGEDLRGRLGHPYSEEDGKHYCFECALKHKPVSQEEIGRILDFHSAESYYVESDKIIFIGRE